MMRELALGDVLEQVVRIMAMLYFAALFLPKGIAQAAGGASLGAGFGALATIILFLRYYYTNKLIVKNETIVLETTRSIFKRLLKLVLPLATASLMLPIGANLDLIIVPRRLQAAGYTMRAATSMFGYLTGVAMPLLSAATVFSVAMTASLIPALKKATINGSKKLIKLKVKKILLLALVALIPSSIALYVGGEKLATFIYNAKEAGPVVKTISLGVVFLGFQQISTGILQSLGYMRIPLFTMLIATVCKVLLDWQLVGDAKWGICGAGLATVTDFALAALLNLLCIKKVLEK